MKRGETSETVGQLTAEKSGEERRTRGVAVGIVVIGRNEGDRLRRCLHTVLLQSVPAVYVDSGSRDDSVRVARELGVEVVELGPERPFTAARARNAGARHLVLHNPRLQFLQFLDGDTEMVAGWLGEAVKAFEQNPEVVAVCGRRRERAPEASIYNRLCDFEWNTPCGEADAFGGDVLLRIDSFEAAGGYAEHLIAGEDPDLSLRLRKSGGRIRRIDVEMTLHDAAMKSFSQWWMRAVRSGHAFAEGAHRHADVGFWSKEVRSNWAWGAVLPLGAVIGCIPSLGLSGLCVSAAYVALFAKVARRAQRDRGLRPADAALLAAATAGAKLPLALGQARFVWSRIRGSRDTLIEYKRS